MTFDPEDIFPDDEEAQGNVEYFYQKFGSAVSDNLFLDLKRFQGENAEDLLEVSLNDVFERKASSPVVQKLIDDRDEAFVGYLLSGYDSSEELVAAWVESEGDD